MKFFGRQFRKPLETMVPGQPGIELVSWYKKFKTYYPTCELQSKRWMVENVEKNWVCLDAGANVGYHSILMARLAHQGFVHAFEPTRTFSMLRDNVRHSGQTNIILNQVALRASSQGKGEKLYRIWGGKPERYSGNWTSVDEYLGSQGSPRLDFLKIDVDGFDLEVLQGAKESIAAFRPVVLVEINHALATRGKTASDIFEFMLGLKYEHALVLDQDNYVFTSSWTLGEPWPRDLHLAFDFRDTLDMTDRRYGLSSNSKRISSVLFRPHNNTKLSAHLYRTSGPAWQYSLEVTGANIWGRGNAAQIDLEVLSGQLGIFVTDSRRKKILGRERVIKPGNPVTVVIEEIPETAHSLIFRKTTDEDLRFSLGRLLVGTLVKKITENGALPEERAGVIPSAVAVKAASTSNWFAESFRNIQIGGALDLARWLDISSPPSNLESRSSFNSYDHTMEREDAHYLRWLWSSLAPEKHFEFGTWEGFGASLVLKSTKAHVWTLNLAAGEQGSTGAQYTESREPDMREMFLGTKGVASDDASGVGWMYRSLELSDRVTQLFGDSLTFDHLFMGKDYFDTIFIDGGHQVEIVTSDQTKAVEMLRLGGVVVWHDFSVDKRVVDEHSSCHGVASAVAGNMDFLRSQLDLFWLEGTFLLIGKKRRP